MKTFLLKGSSRWSGLRSGQRAAALCGAFFLTIGLLFTGCPSPTDPAPKKPVVPGAVDKTALEAAISEAVDNIESVLVAEDASTVPDTAEWVIQADKDAYQDAIDAAKAVNDNAAATQAQVDAAKLALDEATTIFNGAKDTGSLQIDKTALEAAITAAGTAIAAVTVSVDGSDVSSTRQWVSQGDKDTYQAAIDAATGVLNNNAATQALVDEAVSELAAATTAFTEAQSAGTALSISGTLTGGRHWGIVKIWADASATGDPIKELTLKNETAWEFAISASYIGQTLYATVEDDIYGGVSTPVSIAVVEAGVTGVELALATTIPTGKNAALAYKTATATATKAGSNALNALDGKNNTRWDIGVRASNVEELEIDFGFAVTANAIAIRARDIYFNGVTVSYKASAGATDWTVAATHNPTGFVIPNSNDGNTVWPLWFSEVTGTQFKLTVGIKTTTDSRDPGIFEFELYNAGFDRGALETAIEDAETLLDETVEAATGAAISSSLFWALAEDRTTYKNAIATAKAAKDNPAIDEEADITSAIDDLAAATVVFNSKRAAGEALNNLALLAAIADAKKLRDYPKVAENGTALYTNQKWVLLSVKETYATAIETAENTNMTTSQSTIDTAVSTLEGATETFTNAIQSGTQANAANTNIAPRYQTVTGATFKNNAWGNIAVFGAGGNMDIDKAVDGNTGSRLAANTPGKPTYLELDFGGDVTIAKGELAAFGSNTNSSGRIKAFTIEYWDAGDGEWKAVFTRESTEQIPGSNGYNATYVLAFDLTADTTAQKFRLYLTDFADDFSIWEFRLITPAAQ